MSNTKYISGVTVYNINCDDDIIYVDTSASAVSIVLPNIQNSGITLLTNKTFTINDYTNNASVNNISIVASGNTVNSGQATAINSNNGSAFATIVGVNSWQVTTDNTVTSLYGATFFDATTQTNGGATVANQVLISSIQASNGFSLGTNRINVLNAGVYFLTASLQLAFTGGASNYNVTVWYTINDAIVDNSAFTFTTTGAQNDQTLAVITDTISLTAGQYLKFYWWSQATGMRLITTPAGTNPTRPLSPSVNISIFNIG
jgi:hypothetical protein